jgi:tetratricopeptide (TPR) repeat protein
MNRVVPLFSFMLLSICLVAQPQGTRSLTGLEYGDNPVGFRFLKCTDPSRSGFIEQKDRSRRIVPIYLWYPSKYDSQDNESSKVGLKEYLKYWSLETDYDVPEDSTYFYVQTNFKKSFFWLTDLSNFDKLFNVQLKTEVVENMPIKNGKFPIVILNHGQILNWHFVAEYLTSHGFIVAFAPVAGTYDKRLEAGISGIETQLRDMEFVIGQLSSIPEADTDNIGVIGHSLGSLAAVGLASKNKSVKAVISLDGVIGGLDEGDLLYEIPYFNNHRFTDPLLHISSGADFTSDMTKIDKFQFSDRYILELKGMRHADFTGQGHYDKLGINMIGDAIGDYTSGFQMSNIYSLSFLNAQLKNYSLEPFNKLFEQTDNDSLVIRKIKKRKEVKGYEYPDLIKLGFNQEFDSLFEIHQRHKHLEIKAFSYSTFLDVGMLLYFRAYYKESLEWFGFFTESYPNSVKAHYQMANSMRRLGDNQLAIPVMKKAKTLLENDIFLTDNQKRLYSRRIDDILRRLEKL